MERIVCLPGDAFLQIPETPLNWFDSGIAPVFPGDTRYKVQPYWLRGDRHISDLMLSQRTFFDFEADMFSDAYSFDHALWPLHRPYALYDMFDLFPYNSTVSSKEEEVNPYTKKPIQPRKTSFEDVMARAIESIDKKIESHKKWRTRLPTWYIPEADRKEPLDKNEPLLLLAIRGELQWTQWNAFGVVRWSAYRKSGFVENLQRVVNESAVKPPAWLFSIGGYGNAAKIALTKNNGESK